MLVSRGRHLFIKNQRMQHFLSLMIPTTVPLGRGTSTSGEQARPRSWFPEALPTPPPPQALVAPATLSHNSSCGHPQPISVPCNSCYIHSLAYFPIL